MSNNHLCPKYVEGEVNEQTHNYYSLSSTRALKIKSLALPVAEAVTVLMSSGEADHGKTIKDYVGPNKQVIGVETIFNPETPAIIEARSKTRAAAVARLLEACLDERNALMLCELMMDSRREDFDRKEFEAKHVRAVFDSSDIVTLLAHLKHVAKANLAVFGPLAEKLQLAASKAVEKANQKLELEPTPLKETAGTT